MVTSISIRYALQPVPFSDLNVSQTTCSFSPLLRLSHPQMWGPLGWGIPFSLFGSCCSTLPCVPVCWSVVQIWLRSENLNRGPQIVLGVILWIFPDLTYASPCSLSDNSPGIYSLQFFDSTLHYGFRCQGLYLYIGLILSGYNVPLCPVFVNVFCLFLCTKIHHVFCVVYYFDKV